MYYNKRSIQVAWIKADSKAILAIHDHVITNKEKIKVTRNDRSTYILTIEGVSTADEGFYMCQVNSEPMLHQVKKIITKYEKCRCSFTVMTIVLIIYCFNNRLKLT